MQELRTLEDQTEPIVKIMEQEDVTKHIQQSRDGRQLFDILSKDFDVSAVFTFLYHSLLVLLSYIVHYSML